MVLSLSLTSSLFFVTIFKIDFFGPESSCAFKVWLYLRSTSRRHSFKRTHSASAIQRSIFRHRVAISRVRKPRDRFSQSQLCKMRVSTITSILFISPFTLGIPLQVRATTLSVDQILKTSPKSSTCAGAGANPADQCRTAAQAAPLIAQVLGNYGITSPGEVAAVIADMAWESDDFKRSLPFNGGNPGQGSKCFHFLYCVIWKLSFDSAQYAIRGIQSEIRQFDPSSVACTSRTQSR